MSRKHYIFSTIIGIAVGGLLAVVLSLVQRSFYPYLNFERGMPIVLREAPVAMFYDYPWRYFTSLFAPSFIVLFSLVLAKKYSKVWREVTTRVYCVILALLGYSIGWYSIATPLFLGTAGVYILKPVELFLFDFILGPLLVFFAIYGFGIYSNLLGVILLIAVAYYTTQGIESIGKRALIFVLIIWLGLWPYGTTFPSPG